METNLIAPETQLLKLVAQNIAKSILDEVLPIIKSAIEQPHQITALPQDESPVDRKTIAK